jgi:hypothetical protein
VTLKEIIEARDMQALLHLISDDKIKRWELTPSQLDNICHIIKIKDFDALINFIITNDLGMLTTLTLNILENINGNSYS